MKFVVYEKDKNIISSPGAKSRISKKKLTILKIQIFGIFI